MIVSQAPYLICLFVPEVLLSPRRFIAVGDWHLIPLLVLLDLLENWQAHLLVIETVAFNAIEQQLVILINAGNTVLFQLLLLLDFRSLELLVLSLVIHIDIPLLVQLVLGVEYGTLELQIGV